MLSGEFAFLTEGSAEIPDHWELFWGGAPEGVRATSGYDRVLLPHADTPTLASARAEGISGIGYYHEIARVRPGHASEYLELYDAHWRPFLERLGMRRVGTYRTLPKELGLDQGPEFVSLHLENWCKDRGIGRGFCSPGNKNENAFIESFNGRLRDECLNMHWFSSLKEARSIIDS